MIEEENLYMLYGWISIGSTSISPAVGASWWPIPRTPGVPTSLIFLCLGYCVDYPQDESTKQKSWDLPNISLTDPISGELRLVVVFAGGNRWDHFWSQKNGGWSHGQQVSGADGSLDRVPYKHFPQDPSAGMRWYHQTRNLYKPLGQMVSIITQNARMVYGLGCTALQAHVSQPPI